MDALAHYRRRPLRMPVGHPLRPAVTPAHLVPPRSLVLSLSGTDRDDLTDTVALYGVALVAAGVVTGYLLWGR